MIIYYFLNKMSGQSFLKKSMLSYIYELREYKTTDGIDLLFESTREYCSMKENVR
jgi:hypothetical protein